MNTEVCPVCKSKFYSERTFFERKSALHNYCKLNKKSKEMKERRPVRTSTPVSELENSPLQNASDSDSVEDFFYQSWKSGLLLGETKTHHAPRNYWNQQSHTVQQPLYYVPQIVYVNTVIYQPYIPVQQVGYRPDGTFGILPTYWSPTGY